MQLKCNSQEQLHRNFHSPTPATATYDDSYQPKPNPYN